MERSARLMQGLHVLPPNATTVKKLRGQQQKFEDSLS